MRLVSLVAIACICAGAPSAAQEESALGPYAAPPPPYAWVYEPPSARVTASMTDVGLRSMLDRMTEQLEACESDRDGLASAGEVHAGWVSHLQLCVTRLKATSYAVRADLRRRLGDETADALAAGETPEGLGEEQATFAATWMALAALEPRVDELGRFAANELRDIAFGERSDPFHDTDPVPDAD